MSDSEGGKSLPWMVGALMAAILALGWGFAAAEYARDVENLYPVARGGRSHPTDFMDWALATFFENAIEQLPNAGAVFSHVATQSRWVLFVFGGLEAAAVVFGLYAWRLGRQFAEADKNRHSKKITRR